MKNSILALMMQAFFHLIPLGNVDSQPGLLPMQVLCNHLVESNEINNCEDISCNAIFIYKIFEIEKDSIGIYAFGANSDHFYTFLLLKKADEYQILNAHDLNKDIDCLDKFLSGIGRRIEYSDISNLFSIYKANSKYHKTPPNIIVNGHVVDTPLYDNRRIIDVKPFKWKALR